MKAALYARVSTEDQAREEKVSLETQTSDIERYCQDKGYELVKPYYVDIQSGSDTMKERPEFERMLAEAQQGLFNMIVVWQPDRLFRSMWPAARLKRTIDETGIDIEAVKQPLDKKMLGLWAWLAEMEIENFKERSRMGKRGVARKGQIVTRQVPYGYCVDEQRYPQINEAEAYIVRRIFQEYVVENKPVQWIANDLNAAKVPLRNEAKFGWSPPYIHRILKDKTYIGQGAYGKYRYTGNKSRKQPEETHITIPFPPIIDENLFEAAQEKKAQTVRATQHHYKAFHLLRDLAYCRECGYKFLPRDFWTHRTHRKSGKVYEYRYKKPLRYYKCFGMFRYPGRFNCRKPGFIKASELDELVWQKLVEVIQNPAVVAQGMEACCEQASKTALSEELDSVRQQLSDLSWKRQKAINLQIRGVITEQDLSIQLKFINSRKEFLESEVKRLSRAIGEVENKEINFATLEQVSSQIRDRLQTIIDEERAELAQLLIRRVWVDGVGNIDIEFAIPERIPAPCNADVKPRDSEDVGCP